LIRRCILEFGWIEGYGKYLTVLTSPEFFCIVEVY